LCVLTPPIRLGSNIAEQLWKTFIYLVILQIFLFIHEFYLLLLPLSKVGWCGETG